MESMEKAGQSLLSMFKASKTSLIDDKLRQIEPHRIKVVESIKITTEAERQELLKEAHYNPFLLKAEDVIIDLLTDSGTSAMSAMQWSAMMKGDESYAGAKSWFEFKRVIESVTGFPHILPTHQGRAGEHLLYGHLGGPGKVSISNGHFDTTRANIEFTGAQAIDCPSQAFLADSNVHPFQGNIELEDLQKTIDEKGSENVAGVILTVTNNTGGGQPVSMANAKGVREICDKYNIPFFLDACRIAENAWFIREREAGYRGRSYRSIATEMFSLADGCVMSAKKDALANIGGFIGLKSDSLAEELQCRLIITEGYATYGGLSGRDMEAIAVGFQEVFEEGYLNYRMRSTAFLSSKIIEAGIPIVQPVGGHAVYIDAAALLPHIPKEQFPGQVLSCYLYSKGGVRGCEIGSVMFGKYDESGQPILAQKELVRLAIPRRVYTKSHAEYVVEVLKALLEETSTLRGLKIVYEPKFLRHFTAHFEQV